MEQIAKSHPEWFDGRRSIKTPYGTVKLTKTTKLEVPNEEAAIARLEREAFARYPGEDAVAKAARASFLDQYTRTTRALNKEALESEDDAFLKLIGVSRATEDSFSAKAATIDLGKAVKTAEPAEQQEAA